ncbi:MAG TPA: hypothetical protein PK977_01505 [Chitinophagaceae bacterium]|nr:hypothetical protein [Chitinophagaceae bacterium]
MSLYLFSFKDPIPPNYRSAVPPYFRVTTATTYDVLLIRLLTSTLDISNSKTNKNIKLTSNFTVFPAFTVSRKSAKQIRAFISPFNLSDYIKYSQKYYGRNITFYHNLLQELTFYFYYSSENQFQSAFVNLYRTLEYLSYSFPLMHASHFGNYIGSFEALRAYFTDANTSELKFFESFVARLFQGTPYLSLTTNFDFSHPDILVANNCFDSFKGLMKATDWTTANKLTHSLSIENSNLIKLFKNVRNRYFHFAVGG